MNEGNPKSSGRIMGVIGALAAVALLSVGVLAGSLFTRPAAAAGPTSASGPDHAITVAGNGEVHLKPDMAIVNFQIHVLGATSEEALAAYEKAAAALTARLKELGLADADIVLQPASTWPVPPESKGVAEAASGNYYSDGTISVTVRDLDKLRDTVMDGLKAGEGIGLSYIQYALQDDAAARDQALVKAIENARSQADAVAAKLGLQVKEVVSVTVNPNYSGPIMYDKAAMGGAQAPSDGANFAQLGSRPDMIVNVAVQVSYNFQ